MSDAAGRGDGVPPPVRAVLARPLRREPGRRRVRARRCSVTWPPSCASAPTATRGCSPAYAEVQFRAPVRAGDVLEVTATVVRVGTRSRTVEFACRVVCRGTPGRRRVGGRGARPADRGGDRDRHRRRARDPASSRCAGRVRSTSGRPDTKVAVVDLDRRRARATAAHPTTVGTDVLHGLDAAVAALPRRRRAGRRRGTCCSSAGGGLRLAVVGYEALVTAEAGHRVGLSAGARVVHVAAGRAGRRRHAGARAGRGPDVVLLVGGTDGGDGDVLLHNARPAGRGPVAGAGRRGRQRRRPRRGRRTCYRPGACRRRRRRTCCPASGSLDPGPARAAIREVFLRHVIGGKRLSRGPRFARLVRAATPDAVLTGVSSCSPTIDRRGPRWSSTWAARPPTCTRRSSPTSGRRPGRRSPGRCGGPGPSRGTSGCGGARRGGRRRRPGARHPASRRARRRRRRRGR